MLLLASGLMAARGAEARPDSEHDALCDGGASVPAPVLARNVAELAQDVILNQERQNNAENRLWIDNIALFPRYG